MNKLEKFTMSASDKRQQQPKADMPVVETCKKKGVIGWLREKVYSKEELESLEIERRQKEAAKNKGKINKEETKQAPKANKK